jgi:hypothetical protein
MRLIMICVHKDVSDLVVQDGSAPPRLPPSGAMQAMAFLLMLFGCTPLAVVPGSAAPPRKDGRRALPYLPTAGITFLQAKVFECFILAFSIPYTISAFFFTQTYPAGPNLTDNPRACLDGNADHDRMSVGAAGAGRGAGASWHAGQKPVCGDE